MIRRADICGRLTERMAAAPMILDPATLTVAFVLLSTVLGTLLIFSWVLSRGVSALAWWGSAFLLIGIAIASANLGQGQPSPLVLVTANALAMLAYSALYAGCRIFNGRSVPVIGTLAGVVLWIGAFPFIYDSQGYRLMLASLLTGSYAMLSAWELGRHQVVSLASQRVAVALLLGLSIFNLSRGLLGPSWVSIPWVAAFASRWSSEMALFLVVFTPTLAFMFLSMAKERLKFEYKQAALVDPLTSVPNRRAFLQNAAKLLGQIGSRPASCLLFDLDNFKTINDRYGHEAGDRILIVFGQVLAGHLPKRTFGRLGGEEFAAIVPLDTGEAAALADKIRHAFAAAGKAALGGQAEVTVSAGCAAGVRLEAAALLQKADSALYRAKNSGRNIVIAA
jgi:diguanylate cyclase (GGDEF)-like protein